MSSLISVILPCWNVDKYIERSLNSILNQTLSGLEVICINDGSTDKTGEILEYYQRNHNIKVIHQINRGVSNARNVGIECANGEYLSFIDPDDYIDYDFYEKLYHKAIDIRADIVKGNGAFVDRHGTTKIAPDNEKICSSSSPNIDNFISFWFSAIYNRISVVNKFHIRFPETIYHKEDMVFLFCCKIVSSNWGVVNDTFYYYCDNPKSYTKRADNTYAKQAFINLQMRIEFMNKLNQIRKSEYIKYFKTILAACNFYFNQYGVKRFDKERIFDIITVLNNIYMLCKYKNDIFSDDIYSYFDETNKKFIISTLSI